MEEMFPRTARIRTWRRSNPPGWSRPSRRCLGRRRSSRSTFRRRVCVAISTTSKRRGCCSISCIRRSTGQAGEIVREACTRGARQGDPTTASSFSIKIVLGENLQPIRDTGANARIDSFVTLSDERGQKIAKTRTIYETSEPRWDEVFDVHVEQPMWLAATVWDRQTDRRPQPLRPRYLRLDPRYFGDFVSHELWMDLDTLGRLLVRVSMEGERDDILYHFGRGFRSLKRAESDMVRIIVDKMSVFIRQCLSRSLLKTLVKTSGINLDKAIGNVKALYASALASTNVNASVIPPVEPEVKPKNRPVQLTDHEIEAAIIPLFDYLDECLATLKGSLSEHEALLVLTKV